MKQMNGLAVLALAATLGVSGCTAVEYVAVSPECSPVVRPVLPVLDRGELWDALGDAQYRQVERYINGLWAVIDEQEAILGRVCARQATN